MSPDDLVPILALAFLAGLNGPMAGRRTLFALTAAWFAGGVAGFYSGQTPVPGAAAALSFLVLGGLTAADRRLSPRVVTAVAVVIGMLPWVAERGGHGAGPARVARLVGIAARCSSWSRWCRRSSCLFAPRGRASQCGWQAVGSRRLAC